MLTFVLHPQDRIIRASSLEEFVERYRANSWRPETTTDAFMKACARRAKRFNILLNHTTPEQFVISLMEAGMISLDKQDLQ